MTLTTKLDIGCKVWTMCENIVVESSVYFINASRHTDTDKVDYTAEKVVKGGNFYFSESALGKTVFLTKEELLKSL